MITDTNFLRLSDEQKLFIEYPDVVDSKLFAPPGSGKSTCIIQRHIYLVKQDIIAKNQSLILSFSRNSRQDIENRVLSYDNHSTYFQVSESGTIENIKTLDALSYQIQLSIGRVPNYEDLSYDLSCILNSEQAKNYLWRELPILRDLKVMFVDEAQDLDSYQYNIIVKLQYFLKYCIILVGDPNQSIYNFKKSSPLFMIHFPATEFFLTKNFRSSPAIVEFAEYLKPHVTSQGKETKSFASHTANKKPEIHHTLFNDFSVWLVQYLQRYPDDLSSVAILCPTKGHSSSSRKNSKFITKQTKLHGLARITNLLDRHNIPFTQGYNESSDSDNQCSFETKTGQVNVLTFHGSKGKEWDTVICCDVWHELLNSQPSRSELMDQKYLLFVAMTRARLHLIIHVEKMEESENRLVRCRLPNQFLTRIPQHVYIGKFQNLPKSYPLRENRHQISSITEIVKKMPHDMRSELREIVKWNIVRREQVYHDYREICEPIVKHDNILFGEFLENLFSMQCAFHRHVKPREINIVNAFLTGKKVSLSTSEFAVIYPVWNSINDWHIYDMNLKNLSVLQKKLITTHFSRSIEWKNHFLTNDDSYELLWDQHTLISESYKSYMNLTINWKEKLESLFFLTVIQYTYGNNHFFHIRNAAKTKKHLINVELYALFEDMSNYAAKFVSNVSFDEQLPVRIPYLQIDGIIDIQFNNSTQQIQDNRIMETKACKDIGAFPHICQVFFYLLCDMHDFNDLNTREVILYNFMSGEILVMHFTIQESDMMRLFTILAVSSGTLLDSMTLRLHIDLNGNGNHETNNVQIVIRNEEYKFNWLSALDNQNIATFQQFLDCTNGKCRIICDGQLAEKRKYLTDRGISFKHLISNQIVDLTHNPTGSGTGSGTRSGTSIEISWIDASWINSTFWEESGKSQNQTKETPKRQNVGLGTNYYKNDEDL